MFNQFARILSAAAVVAASGHAAFAQAYANTDRQGSYAPEPYAPESYAQEPQAAAPYGPAPAYPPEVYQDQGADRRAPPSYGPPREAQAEGYAYQEQRVSIRRVAYLTWSGKAQSQDEAGDAYARTTGYAASCPVAPGERVLTCRYIPFAPPPRETESAGGEIADLYIDGGVGPTFIGGGGGGGGGPSNDQVTIGTGFNSGFSQHGGGSGSGAANSSSSASASASASVSANISSSISLKGGFFGGGKGGGGGGGHKGGGSSSCGCQTGGGSSGGSGWSSGSGGMGGGGVGWGSSGGKSGGRGGRK